MGKRYLDTKKDSLESSILSVWQEASLKQEKLVGGQKKLDKDKDGDIDAKDFAMLRKAAKKNKKVNELTKAQEKLPPALQKAIKDKEKKEEVKEYYEMGTDEYRKHTQEVTPGQQIQDYGRMKMQSMKEALAKVWGLDESDSSMKKEKKDLTKELKDGKTLTGKKSDTVDVEPKLEKKK